MDFSRQMRTFFIIFHRSLSFTIAHFWAKMSDELYRSYQKVCFRPWKFIAHSIVLNLDKRIPSFIPKVCTENDHFFTKKTLCNSWSKESNFCFYCDNHFCVILKFRRFYRKFSVAHYGSLSLFSARWELSFMEANWVFEMQRNYIAFQTPPLLLSVFTFYRYQFYKTETCSCTSQACETVKEKVLIDWELWVVGKQFVFMWELMCFYKALIMNKKLV